MKCLDRDNKAAGGEIVKRIKEETIPAAQEILHEATEEAMIEMRRAIERAKEEAMKEATPVAEVCTTSLSVLEENIWRTEDKLSDLNAQLEKEEKRLEEILRRTSDHSQLPRPSI